MQNSLELKTRLSYKKLATAVAFAAAATSSGTLLAQDDIEEIQVTGSFISRPADRPQPVSIMDNEEIQANQRVTLTEVVRDMPQISSANTTSNFNAVSNTINLRGLGTRSTLILLNGQRQTIDANGGSVVDINNLAPSIMVERLELVLDGASALYGSDAVAGVANFITRNNFEGAEFSVSSQHAEAQSSVPEVLMGAIFGVQGDDMGLVMSLEWANRSEMMDTTDIDSNARREVGLVTGLYNPGTFGALGPPRAGDVRVQGGWFRDPLCGDPIIGGDPGNSITDLAGAIEKSSAGEDNPNDVFCRGSLTNGRTMIPESERMTGMAVAHKDFDGDWVRSLTVEMNFAKTEYQSHFGTGVPLLALPEVNAVLPATNPGVIEANRASNGAFPLQDYRTVFTRQLSPLEGALSNVATQHTFRTAVTLDGSFGDAPWDWRLTGTFSQNDQFDQDVDTITDRYARALQGYGGPSCKWNFVDGVANDANGRQAGVGACQYWNPMANRLLAQPGDATYNDPALLEWMQYGAVTLGEAQFYSMEGVVTGELWEMGGGTTGVAIGTQYRRQVLDLTYDPIAHDGGFGFSPQVLRNWDSTRDTEALFAELVMFPTDTLELDFAARYEKTLGQSSVEPKASLLWTPRDDLYIRASAGSSFRLPTENNSFGIGNGAVSRATIGGEVTQAVGIAVGNPNLSPEESDNWTIGFTWDVTDNFTVEATWWDYEFTNLVTTTDPNAVLLDDMADGFVTNSAAHPLFPGRPNEVCEITGRWSGNTADPLPAGCMTGFDIQIFNSSYINQNSVETSGADLVLDFTTDMFGGEAGLRFLGSYVSKYAGTNTQGQIQDVVGTDGFNVAGVGTNPQIRANMIGTFRTGSHSTRATLRYTDGTEITNPNPLTQGRTSEASFSQLDLTYTYTLPTASDSSLTIAVLNAGDRRPPIVANGLTTYNDGLYDGRGRMWRASYNVSF